MGKLQHVRNAPACLVTGTRKYEHGLSRLMHDDLHWLVIPQRVQYKARCDSPTLSSAPSSMVHILRRLLCASLRTPMFLVAGICDLPDIINTVLRVRRSTFGTRAFSVAGPTVWNSLPDHLRDPAVDSEQFRRDLKTYLFRLFAGHSKRYSALEVLRNRAVQIDIHFTYTYRLSLYVLIIGIFV